MTLQPDFDGAAVIVTGGTRGLGKALGMEFARANATVFLTHRWHSVDEDQLVEEFRTAGLAPPFVIESDASDPADTRDLMTEVERRSNSLLAIVSNVSFAQIVRAMEQMERRSFELSLRYSTWPVLDLLRSAKEIIGTYPRYVLAMSSDGGTVCHPGYEMVGVSKAALETLCRYLAVRLRSEGVRVNAVRCGPLDTESSRTLLGDAALDSERARSRGLIMDPRSVARACVGLCSGLMDSITGQVVTVDEGFSLLSPAVYLMDSGWPGPFPGNGE